MLCISLALLSAPHRQRARALTRRDPRLAVLLMSADPPEYAYSLLEASGARGLVARAHLARLDLGRFWPDPRAP